MTMCAGKKQIRAIRASGLPITVRRKQSASNKYVFHSNPVPYNSKKIMRIQGKAPLFITPFRQVLRTRRPPGADDLPAKDEEIKIVGPTENEQTNPFSSAPNGIPVPAGLADPTQSGTCDLPAKDKKIKIMGPTENEQTNQFSSTPAGINPLPDN